MNPLLAAEILQEEIAAGRIDAASAAVTFATEYGSTLDSAERIVTGAREFRTIAYGHKLLTAAFFLAKHVFDQGDEITARLALNYVADHPAKTFVHEAMTEFGA
jgi:hypothetical protein